MSCDFLYLLHFSKEGTGELKIKIIVFNVAYNVTDNISSRAILQHNNYIFNRYLPALLYLPSTTPFCERQQGSCWYLFYTFGMVRLWDSNPRPPAPKADPLPTEL